MHSFTATTTPNNNNDKDNDNNSEGADGGDGVMGMTGVKVNVIYVPVEVDLKSAMRPRDLFLVLRGLIWGLSGGPRGSRGHPGDPMGP